MAYLNRVEKASQSPYRCAVLNTTEGPFFDTGNYLEDPYDPRVYVSFGAVRAMANRLDMCDRSDLVVVEGRVRELEAEVEELREFKKHAAYTMSALGVSVRAKPGRKPAKAGV